MMLTCEQCKQRKDGLKVQFEIVGDRLLCEGCAKQAESAFIKTMSERINIRGLL